jgi:hypothetical protein
MGCDCASLLDGREEEGGRGVRGMGMVVTDRFPLVFQWIRVGR